MTWHCILQNPEFCRRAYTLRVASRPIIAAIGCGLLAVRQCCTFITSCLLPNNCPDAPKTGRSIKGGQTFFEYVPYVPERVWKSCVYSIRFQCLSVRGAFTTRVNANSSYYLSTTSNPSSRHRALSKYHFWFFLEKVKIREEKEERT